MLTYRWVCVLALAAVFAAGCVNAPHSADPGVDDASDGGQTSDPGHLKACLYDGDTEISCSQISQSLDVALSSTPLDMGVTLHRTLKLIGDGPGFVTVNGFTTTGSTEVSLAPTSSDFHAVALAAGEDVSFDVALTPTVGGAGSTTLTFQTTDPDQPTLVVTLNWAGDGPALCLCVRESEGSAICHPTTSVDFGTVGVGLSERRFLRLASCGTQPVTFERAEITNAASSESFGATGLPAVGSTLAPGGAPIDAVLDFSPALPKPYTGSNDGGRLRIETSNQQLVVNLTGNGKDGGCRLVPATMVFDFGQGGVNVVTQRILALSNTGSEECTFPWSASVTMGQSTRFEVISAPMTALAPGQTAAVTLGYVPQDAVGPDTGELSIPYASATGSGTLVIELRGTPVVVSLCTLDVQPGGGPSMFRNLDFGAVAASQATKVLTITLKNIGMESCTISKVGLVAGAFVSAASTGTPLNDFRVLTVPTSPIAPGKSAIVEVSYTPSLVSDGPPMLGGLGAGPYGINLTMQTDDTRFPGQDCSSIQLGATAIPGCIGWGLLGWGALREFRIVPDRVDFGAVSVGCQPAEATVTIHNTGAVPVQVKGLSIDPVIQPPIFSIVPGTLPISLNPGASYTVRLRYAPPDANLHSANLFVMVDGTVTNMSVVGRGTTDSHHTDTFQQQTAPKTDVLFVVGDSTSMAQEHNLLASGGQVFLEEADRLGVDYQVAVVTTNMSLSGQSGLFQGTPRIITSSASAVSQFSNTVTAVGITNTGKSPGLEAMFRALSPPLITNTTMNGGFLRWNARLAVVVVSDEEDASRASTAFYKDFLWNVKGARHQSMVSLSTIVGDVPNGCMNSNGAGSPAYRYQDVQLATGGEFHSICTYDWTSIAQDLSHSVFAAQSAFTLSAWADASTITVSVSGVTVPSTDWTYDGPTNTLSFNPSAIPPAGAIVVIDYDMLCL